MCRRDSPSAAGPSRSLTGETLVWQEGASTGGFKAPPELWGPSSNVSESSGTEKAAMCVSSPAKGPDIANRHAGVHTCTPTHAQVHTHAHTCPCGARPGPRVCTPIGTRTCTHTLMPPALPSRGSVFSAAGLVRRCLPPLLRRTRSARPAASPPQRKGHPHQTRGSPSQWCLPVHTGKTESFSNPFQEKLKTPGRGGGQRSKGRPDPAFTAQ